MILFATHIKPIFHIFFCPLAQKKNGINKRLVCFSYAHHNDMVGDDDALHIKKHILLYSMLPYDPYH